MSGTSTFPHLTRAQAFARVALSCGISLMLCGLRYINPESVSWFPLRTSCGAFTGLPCIFCGTTRGMHHLLNGEFARAIYFNWIAFPIAAVAFAATILCVVELTVRRRLFVARFSFSATPKSLAWTSGAFAALWLLQVSLAVGMHKRELLNPAGPLYTLFVK